MTTPGALADPYEELGVSRSATRDEITAAYRSRAKAVHPDARPDDAEAAEQFKRVGAAYRLLSDPVARARYDLLDQVEQVDQVAAGSTPPRRPDPPGVVSAPSAARPPVAARRGRVRLTRRGARGAVAGGALLMVLAVVVAGFVLSLQRRDARLQANGVAAQATVVQRDGNRLLEFTTTGGRRIRAAEPVKSGEEQPSVGARVAIHYDPRHPTSITTDASHLARNITLWVVAVKFLVGGATLLWFGARRLRRPNG